MEDTGARKASKGREDTEARIQGNPHKSRGHEGRKKEGHRKEDETQRNEWSKPRTRTQEDEEGQSKRET